MANLKLNTPMGFRDLLHRDYLQKRALEDTVAAMFARYGYSFVSSPGLEYLEVFEERGSIPAAEMYKFIDRNGRLLALRPDMTPAAARIAASYDFTVPIRLCYIEKAFRHHEEQRGYENEFTQAGAELVCGLSAEADAESIMLNMHILQAAGLTDFRIDLGHIGFLPGILTELSAYISAEDAGAITRAILARDYVAAEEKARSLTDGCNVQAARLLCDLVGLSGGPEVLSRAKELATNLHALAAIAHLEAVYGLLAEQGLAAHILIDLGMLGRLGYYTGIIFKGYARGSGTAIADGGRYEIGASAVGFGIRIEGVLDALKAAGVQFEYALTETLLVYEEPQRKTALATATVMRRQGLNIETALEAGDLEARKTYAAERGLKGIIYFGAGGETGAGGAAGAGDEDGATGKVRLINLETGAENEIALEELVKC